MPQIEVNKEQLFLALGLVAGVPVTLSEPRGQSFNDRLMTTMRSCP